MICDQLPATLLLPASAGQPTKNERPHHVRRDTPNAILQPTSLHLTPSAEISRDARNRPNQPSPTNGVPLRRATRAEEPAGGLPIHCARDERPGPQGCPSGRASGPALTALVDTRPGACRKAPKTPLTTPGSTDKQGSKLIRWAAIEAAQRLGHDTWLHAERERLAERRNSRAVAKTAIARKLITLTYYGLRDGEIRCLNQPASRAA
jgi:hypothetical protein